MGLNLDYIHGQTPLDEEEKEGLLIPTISTREELDEFEQQNIEQAILWLLGKKLRAKQIFTSNFVCDLHRQMFSEVWAWAGTFRKTDKNLGIDKWQIPTALQSLCDDAHFWVDHATYSHDEIAIRFKHRVVSIHCFPNGNGRHSRLMADVIAENIFKDPVFSWGAKNINQPGEARSAYLKALNLADQGSYSKLLEFARS